MQNLNFGSFCETKSGFNFFAGSFFETKSGFKLYFGSLGGFFFFCAKYQNLKIAVFWPKFTISRVSNKTSHIFLFFYDGIQRNFNSKSAVSRFLGVSEIDN